MSVVLPDPPENILAQVLVNAGLGSDPAPWLDTRTALGNPWPVFRGGAPDRPDSAITVFEDDPQYDAGIMVTGESQQHYKFTIRVTGQSKTPTRNKAATIWQYLNETLYDAKLFLPGGAAPAQEYSVPSARARRLLNLKKQQIGANLLWVYHVDVIAPILAYPTGR